MALRLMNRLPKKRSLSSITIFFIMAPGLLKVLMKAKRNYNLWSCQKVCEALTFLLDNIYIRVGFKLYRQIVGMYFYGY